MQTELSSEESERQRELVRVFLAENEKINLSALRTEEACWTGNIMDSLAILDLFKPIGPFHRPPKIIDIGTGGGFPLLPLALKLPASRCMGLDSIEKKIDALRRIATEMKIENISLIADRAETLARNKQHREQYDLVTSRAVASLATLLEFCVPFATVGGQIVLWKSLHIDEELAQSTAAQQALKVSLTMKYEYDLGGDWGVRQLLVFTKDASTPKMYPREVGMPKKEPIA